MTDRVPGAPGQYKAVVTEAELQKMQSGQPFTITMTRDDKPITEGTPYSKAAVLPDEVAAAICPEVIDPTPADAFSRLLPLKNAENMFARTIARGTYNGDINVLGIKGILGNSVVWLTPTCGNMPRKSYGLCQTWYSGRAYLQVIVFTDGTSCRRIAFDEGAGLSWAEWEWENPPMKAGTEYRTMVKVDGKPVYSILFDFGTLPNATEKSTNHGIKNIKSIISYDAYSYNGGSANLASHPNIRNILVTATNINVSTNANLSSISAKFVLRYIKN